MLEQLPEPPVEESTLAALKRLQDLGALDENDVRDWVLFNSSLWNLNRKIFPVDRPIYNKILLDWPEIVSVWKCWDIIEFPLLIVKYIIYLSQPLINRQKWALDELWK